MNQKKAEKKRHCLPLICALLILMNIALFWSVKNHDFINIDDNNYVTENPEVRAGITPRGIAWAFTSMHASNWHPMTWLSHMLDVQLFGLNPGAHHLINLLFHIATSVLLFLVLFKMTGGLWQSVFVAVVFAVHPLHVESVAWVSERKDVLSAFFFMLTIGAYAFYVEKPGWKRYGAVLILFLLGLLSKPMLVTLPFVLLLLDIWPLNRFAASSSEGLSNKHRPKGKSDRISFLEILLPLLREKIPLFILTAASSILTYLAQEKGGAISTIEALPFLSRAENALTAYIGYIWKWIWPLDLAIPYPLVSHIPLWQVGGAVLILMAITLSVILFARRFPFVLTGWLWYLGTLIPVIGLIQVGSQSMADRYMYLPMIGLLIIPAWGIPRLFSKWRHGLPALVIAGLTLSLLFFVMSRSQVKIWQNSLTLFSHSIQKTTNNYLAQNNLGMALEESGRIEQATYHYTEAIRINPNRASAYNNLGNTLIRRGQIEKAVSYYQTALKKNPDYAGAHYNLGIALASQKHFDEAIWHFRQALRIKPRYKEAHYNWGTILLSQGKFPESLSHFEEALRIDPNYGQAHNNLGSALLMLGKLDESIEHFQRALSLEPGEPTATANLQDAFKLKTYLKSQGS